MYPPPMLSFIRYYTLKKAVWDSRGSIYSQDGGKAVERKQREEGGIGDEDRTLTYRQIP